MFNFKKDKQYNSHNMSLFDRHAMLNCIQSSNILYTTPTEDFYKELIQHFNLNIHKKDILSDIIFTSLLKSNIIKLSPHYSKILVSGFSEKEINFFIDRLNKTLKYKLINSKTAYLFLIFWFQVSLNIKKEIFHTQKKEVLLEYSRLLVHLKDIANTIKHPYFC